MRDSISMRQAIIGAAAILAALAVGLAVYWRSLAAGVLADAPIEVAEVAPDAAALEAAAGALAAARTARGEAVLDEAAANRALFAEWLADPERQVRLVLDPPFARLKLAQRAEGRWLNADLIVAPHAGAEGGLAFRVLSGRVGDVSISKTSGEWVRVRIERQLAADLARNPRTAELFRGLAVVRVTAAGLALKYRAAD